MNDPGLRPRTVGEVLDAAIRLYLRHAGTLVALVACVVVPLEVIAGVAQAATVSHGDQLTTSLFDLHLHLVREPDGTVRDVGPHVSAATVWIQLGVATLVGLLSTAASVRALADLTAGARPSIAASLLAAVARLPGLIALFVLRLIGVVVGIILLIVPGVWIAGAWSVSVPAFMLEGAGPLHALRRSGDLVHGRWWPVVGALVVVDLTVAIVSALVQGAFGAVAGGSAHPTVFAAVLATTLGGIVASSLLQPLDAAVRVVLYLDLRIRRGGEELAVLAEQLGLPEPVAGPDPEPAPVSGPDDPPYWPPPPGWRSR